MSSAKPPRVPRTPPGSGQSDRANLRALLDGDVAQPAPTSSMAWAQLAQARRKLEDGLAEDAAEIAEQVLMELPTPADEDEGYVLQGSAAAVRGLALAEQDEPEADTWLELAVRSFRRAPELTASRRDLAAEQALALAGLGRFPESIELLEWVLALPRESTPLVRRTLAMALASDGRSDEAIELLGEAVQLAPFDWRAHWALARLLDQNDAPPGRRGSAWLRAGEALLANGEIGPAVEAAERALEFGPTPARLDLVGRVHRWTGDHDRAIAAFVQANELTPSAAVLINLAVALADAGRIDDAAQAALDALSLRPSDETLVASAAAHLLAADHLDGVDLAVEQLALRGNAAAAGYRGIVAYRRNDLGLAATELSAALYDAPDDVDLLWAMAEVLSYLGQTDLVIQALDQLLELAPDRADAWAQRGVALVERGHPKERGEAEEALRKSLLLGPDPSVQAFLGEFLMNDGRFAEAAELLAEATAGGYGETWALAAYGQALRGLREDEAAERVFRDLVERDPQDEDAVVGLASALLDKFTTESNAEAAGLVESGLQFAPGSVALLGLHGELLRRGNDLEQAVEFFERALESVPDWPWAQGSLAQSLRGRFEKDGDPADLDRARGLLEAVLSSTPEEPFVLSELAEVAARQGRADEAHEHLKTAFRLAPKELAYLVRRGELYRDQGDLQRARARFERAMELAPDYPGLRTLLANLLAGQHDLKAALQLLQEAIDADPTDPEPWDARFTLRWNSNRFSESMEDLDQLLVLRPGDLEIRARRGDALRLQGQYDEAIEVLDGVLAEDAGQVLALMVRGAMLLARGRIEEARDDLGTAVGIPPTDPFALGQFDELRVVAGEADSAIAELRQQLADAPSAALQLRCAGLLQRCGRPAEALQLLADELWNKLEDPEWQARLGWALLGCQRYEESIACFVRAADLQPDQVFPVLDLFEAELAVGPERARDLAIKVIDERSTEPGGYLARSRVHSSCGDFDGAVEWATKATEHWYQLAGAYSQLGWALHHTTRDGAAQLAYDAYQRSHELEALAPWTVSGLASTLYSLGRIDESKAKYEECLRLVEQQNLPEADRGALHGWCLFRLGRYDDAWPLVMRAVDLAPKPAAMLFDLSLVAAARGRGEEAQLLVARAAEEVQREHPQYRPATLGVARFDLNQLRAEFSPEILALLDQAHARLPR